MPWQSLGEFNLTDDWIFSDLVEGEIFRIFHQPIPSLPAESLRAVIAQGFIDEKSYLNKFSPKIFSYSEELELFTFYFPAGLSQHSIIFKRLDRDSTPWIIQTEVYIAESPEEEYQNYIIDRFGQTAINQFSQTLVNNTVTNMSLYPLLFSGSTTPKSADIKLVANTANKIFSANDARTEIRVQSTGNAAILATGFDETGNPLEVLIRLPPNYYHQDQITSAGMYKGDIWAFSEIETYLYTTEFSAQ